jgi:hypothetical protein
MAADEMPSASGVLRGSLPVPAISRLVRQAGINESRLNPATPTPACLRNALRLDVIAWAFNQSLRPELKTSVEFAGDSDYSLASSRRVMAPGLQPRQNRPVVGRVPSPGVPI